MSKANGKTWIDAGGQRYALTLDFNTLSDIEDAFDLSIDEVQQRLQGSPRLRDVRLLVFHALRPNHPDITERGAGEFLDAVGLARIGAVISDAFAASFPDVESAEEGDKPAATTDDPTPASG